MVTREQMAASIIALRKALAHYADPEEGWDFVEHADVYERSRRLVPDDEEERSDRAEAQL